jgi:SAM-dependent methyltransferase
MINDRGPWSPLVYCPACGEGFVGLQNPRCAVCHEVADVVSRVLVLGDTPTDDYPTDSASAQADVITEHVWFQLRTAVVLEATRGLLRAGARRFVDFGCGNGHLMAALEQQGWETAGVDMHVEGLRRAETATRGTLFCGRIPSVRLLERVDAAGLFDVIEHAPDDLAVLRHVHDQLVPGGAIVITVPAMPALWSEFDVLLGHKRRYTRATLRAVIERAGFICDDVRYCFSFTVPGIWMQRRFLGRTRSSRRAYYTTPSPAASRALRALGRLERTLARHSIRSPFGSSLLAIGRSATVAPASPHAR